MNGPRRLRHLVPGAFALLLAGEGVAAACPKGQFPVFVQDPNNPRNECRACPDGFTRSPQTGKGHKKEECFRVDTEKAIKLSKEEGGVGPVCKKGFWNTPDDRCYTCPKPKDYKDEPYAHDHLKTADKDGVCTRTVTVAPKVVSSSGFTEACEDAMAASLPSTSNPPAWARPAIDQAKSGADAALKLAGVTANDIKKLGESAAGKLTASKQTDAMLEAIKKLRKDPDKLKKVFEPKTMCSVSKVLGVLNDLGLTKELPFFITVSFTASLTAGVSGQYGVVLVTDLTESNTKIYRFAGGALTTELLSAGVSLGIQGFPKARVKSASDFLGFGVGMGGGVNSPWGPGVGIDASVTMPPKIAGASLSLDGFGPNGNLGVGILPIPASAGVSGTYTFKPE